MKLQAPENANYAAVVVRIKSITPLAGCDNIVGTPLLGFQAIVGKDTQVGDIGLVFPAETQLSEGFARANSLHRHAHLNVDGDKQGYLEDNRRIKAMKFRGHRSDCLFLSLDSLAYTGVNVSDLREGNVFDTINGKPICQKYVVKRGTPNTGLAKNKAKVWNRVNEKMTPRHFDTDNYFRNSHIIPENRRVVVTQKLHGTSTRVFNTLVKRKLTWKDRVAQRFGVSVQQHEYDMVYGSRTVIKDVNNKDGGFYKGSDLWVQVGRQLDGILPQGYVVYAEVIGYTPEGAAIQAGYTYDHAPGTNTLYVYRVAHVNPQGRLIDLSWDQVKEFCNDNSLKHVPQLWDGKHGDFGVEPYLDRRFADLDGFEHTVPLGKNKLVDEGVCIRVDGLVPTILKAKSPQFLAFETKQLDKEVVDVEVEA